MREGTELIEWTDEDKERVARSSLAVEAVRRGHLTGEEALLMVITGKPDTPEYMEAIAQRIEEIPWVVVQGRNTGEPTGRAEHRRREAEKYHSDPEYRERCLARRRANRDNDEYRAKERARAARRRAARKAAKP